ncbi:MAG: NAD-dependent deacylase, partial [Desulfonatronospira sp. MSAO_Bac3]
MSNSEKLYQEAAGAIRSSECMLALTGAGISV